MTVERRESERLTARGSVRLAVGGISYFGTLRNLSQAGCMIESADFPTEIGARCEVYLLPGYAASGRVAWQLGEAVGISFIVTVPNALVRELALDDWSMRSNKEPLQARG